MATSVPFKKRRTLDFEIYTPERNVQEKPATIDVDNLLPDVLAMIFSYLDLPDKGRAGQVCQNWRNIMNHPSLFRLVQAHLNSEDTEEQLPILAKRGIRRVIFKCYWPCQICRNKKIDHALLVLAGGLPKLSSIEISCCLPVEATIPVTLLEKMPQLAHLTMSSGVYVISPMGPVSSLNVYRNGLVVEPISQNLTNLVTLRLEVVRLTDTDIRSIVCRLRALKNFEIRCHSDVTDQTIEYLSGLDQQLVHKLNLETLGLIEGAGLTDLSLFYLSQGQKNLKNLNLNFMTMLTDNGLAHLVHLNRLEKLELGNCNRLSDRGMSHIAKMVNLRTLHVVIRDEGLKFLAEGGSKIETLYMMNSLRIDITSRGAQYLSRLTHLRDLYLPDFNSIGEYGMPFLAGMASLQKLRAGLRESNDEGLAQLVDGGSNIISLDLRLSFEITDRGLNHLSKMASLEELSLSICVNITAEGLINLASGRAKITKLDMCGVDFASWEGQRMLAHIANGLFPLQVFTISLKYEFFINADWLKLAAKNLPYLHTLNVGPKNIIGEVRKFRESFEP